MPSVEADLEILLANFMKRHKLSEGFAETAREWYIPLAEILLLHQISAGATFFVGVNGSQGSGKSTLCEFLVEYLSAIHGLHVISLSLDDFYYSTDKRTDLAQKVHPLLKTRGVPGTHDVACMQTTFESLAKQQVPITIPRFNKATDNPYTESDWLNIDKSVDMVLMEGWCWGVRAQNATQLTEPLNRLEATEDIDCSWRNYVNEALSNSYEPLYDTMHYWVMLKAPSFLAVYDWRCEQERKLHERLTTDNAGTETFSGLMNDDDIALFIQHYERLTVYGLETLPDKCDSVFELDFTRRISIARLGN